MSIGQLSGLARGALLVVSLLVVACGGTAPTPPVAKADGGTTNTGTCPKCSGGCCNGKCLDTNTDLKNCGACGKACMAGETCIGGNCQCAGNGHCAAGQTCCPMVGCKTTMTDANNCGTCGNSCDAQNMGETCYQGQCGCTMAGDHCANGQACCGAGTPACTDIMADAANCGTCANACPMGQACAQGMCGGGGGLCGGMPCAGMCLMGICIPGGGGGKCMADADCKIGQKCTSPFMGLPCNILPLCMCQ